MGSVSSVKIIYFGLYYAYDGEEDRPWVETDETNTLKIYGSTKNSGQTKTTVLVVIRM